MVTCRLQGDHRRRLSVLIDPPFYAAIKNTNGNLKGDARK
jgi:hypothetical protein